MFLFFFLWELLRWFYLFRKRVARRLILHFSFRWRQLDRRVSFVQFHFLLLFREVTVDLRLEGSFGLGGGRDAGRGLRSAHIGIDLFLVLQAFVVVLQVILLDQNSVRLIPRAVKMRMEPCRHHSLSLLKLDIYRLTRLYNYFSFLFYLHLILLLFRTTAHTPDNSDQDQDYR